MMLASVPSSVTFAVSRETNEKENNTTHRVKGLALLTRDVPWCDEMSVVKKSRFLRVSSKRRRTTPLVSRRSMRDTTRYIYIYIYIYIFVCAIQIHAMYDDALFGSECVVVHESWCVSAVFNTTEATTKTRLISYYRVSFSSSSTLTTIFTLLDILLGMKCDCGLSYHVTEIG